MAATRCTVTVVLPESNLWYGNEQVRIRLQNVLQQIESAAHWAASAEQFLAECSVRDPFQVGPGGDKWVKATDVFPMIQVEITPLPGFDGRVIKWGRRTERVMSDVWEDVSFPVVWDGEKVRELNSDGFTHQTYPAADEPGLWKVTNHYLPGFEPPPAPGGSDSYSTSFTYLSGVPADHRVKFYTCVRWTVDASEETKAAVAAWEREQERLGVIRNRARSVATYVARVLDDATSVTRDRDALVVAGRKVRKGSTVRVTYVGEGQYGTYANVIDEKGVQVRYVSINNLRAAPEWSWFFKPEHVSGVFGCSNYLTRELCGLFREYAAGRLPWDILCDRVQDEDAELGEFLRAEDPQRFRKRA